MITILFANLLALPIKHSTYFTYMHKQAFSQKGVLGQLWMKHWTPLDTQNLEGKENY